MSARVRLALEEGGEGEAGGAVAIKVAHSPEDTVALQYEISLLRRASHPGLVAVVDDPEPDRGRPELRTRYAGEPLSRWRGDLPGVVGLGAAVAATLADLHALGLVHGRLDPSHVLVGADGRPRLCGFAPPGDRTAADDVAALAELVDGLLDRATSVEPRWAVFSRRSAIADRRAVADVVRRATDPNAARRLSARSLATALLAAVPNATLPRRNPHPFDQPPSPARAGDPFVAPVAEPAIGDRSIHGEDPSPVVHDAVFGDQTTAEVEEVFVDRPWPAPPPLRRPAARSRPRNRQPGGGRRAATAGLVGLGVVAVGALVVHVGRPPSGRTAAASIDPASTAGCGAVPAETSADIDGDGCPDELRVVGGVVEAGGQRWQVGDASDAVAVADWDCDGLATPAVYRPATGDVFVFPSWASADAPVTVAAIDTVAGGRGLVPAASTEPCPQLAVEMPTGERRAVEVHR